MENLLELKNLTVDFSMRDSTVHAVRGVSLSLERGKTLGLVGESGCGKSVTAFSILQLIAPPGRITGGEIFYGGRNLLALESGEMRKVRGKEIAMIFQEPMTSLNPVFRIGYQISETIMLHLNETKSAARDMTVHLLNQVGIPSPEKRYDSYPHELSGGMRQRVMIAIALSARPSILIADEPTTALDVTIQAQILELLMNIQRERNMSLLLISHDLGIVSNIADDIAIMYAGEIVEYGTVERIFDKPMHPYTRGLFASIPRIGDDRDRLNTIPGTVPTITGPPEGCAFAPRCSKKTEECLALPVPLVVKEEGHAVRCIRAE